MSEAFATLAKAVRYGYAHGYLVRIEGIGTLPIEYIGDAIAPTNYSLDASLIIDGAAKLGPVLDAKKHTPSAHDFQFRLLPTAAVTALLTRPTLYTTITNTLSATDTSMNVEDTTNWSGVSTLHFGTSAAPRTGTTKTTFTMTRGVYGRKRSYKAGTLVTNAPYVWRGRRVELFLVLLDPAGLYVQGADILSRACKMWDGYIQDRPIREGATWLFRCRDQARRLSQPLGVAASGKAVWELGDDGFVANFDTSLVFQVRLVEMPGAELCNVQVQPFVAATPPLYLSQMRTLLASALDGVMTSAQLGTPTWERETIYNGMYRYYLLRVPVTTAASQVRAFASITGGGWGKELFEARGQASSQKQGTHGTVDAAVPIWQVAKVNGASLSVLLEDAAPADLPTSGWVLLESEGATSWRRYTSFTIDSADPRQIRLALDSASVPTPDQIHAIAREDVEGDVAEVTAKFMWRMNGSMPDVMRRAIVSTGDAQHGTYDTLAKGLGLGIPDIDESSFVRVFDGAWKDIDLDIAAEAGSSFETLFSGALRLSQRAVTTRRSADGATVHVAAVNVGSADGQPVATIADDNLVSVGGRKPVRVLEEFAGPQVIDVQCRTIPDGDSSGKPDIVLRDPHLVDWTGEKWDLDVFGVTRDVLYPAAYAWALGWFRGGENRQVIEIDVDPTIDAQVGDIVELDLDDSHGWDYATGTPGYHGLARVLGAQIAPRSLVQTIRVMIDGILAAGPFAPSIPIVAVNGTATAPTSIDVDDDWYNLLVAAKGASSTFKLLAYLPGQDKGRAEYTFTAVSLPGGGVARLTPSAYPSSPTVSLSTSYRFTWPVVANGTTTQNRHLNNTDKVQWS